MTMVLVFIVGFVIKDRLIMKITFVFFFSLLHYLVLGDENGYSFYKFSGPVSGPVHEVRRNNRVDYVAKPDYKYSFGVEDPKTGNSQQREETRDGDVVKGEYSVVQSDGMLRVVSYVADPIKGFQASVHYSPHH